ncbi:hypothetical protein K4H02_23405, partial [Mycobacterium tuberculosis]|nr:hypothetical protein [Mycobacterium tuberculosis]
NYITSQPNLPTLRFVHANARTIANPEDVERLRIAYRAARLITARDTPAVAQAWFQGLNPVLDDRAPALLLRDGDLADDTKRGQNGQAPG